MKYIPIITAIVFGCAAAMPAAAHDMCADMAPICPDEIGDMMGVHAEMAESSIIGARPEDLDMGENALGANADPADNDAPGTQSQDPQVGTGPDGWDDYNGFPFYQGSQ